MLPNSVAESLAFLPDSWTYLVIPREGTVLTGKDGRPNRFCGKRPLGGTYNTYRKSQLRAEFQNNDYLAAIGFKPGPQSDGVVVLDIDLAGARARLIETYGVDALPDSFEVTTPKGGGCGKLFYSVDSSLWNRIKGRALTADRGYEILWGRGVNANLLGAYPGKPERGIPAGEYTWHGTPDDIVPAPQWLIDEMVAAFRLDAQPDEDGSRFLPVGFDTYHRTQDDYIRIVRSALAVIPNEGESSENHWSRIGAAIYSVLPNEAGLALWEEWSRQDRAYQADWEHGNPCADRWAKGFRGSVKLGSLMWMAAVALAGTDTDEDKIRYWLRTHFGSHAQSTPQVQVLTPEDFQLPDDLAQRYVSATQGKVGYELLLTQNNFCRRYKIRQDKLEKLVRTWRTEQHREHNPYKGCDNWQQMLEVYEQRVPGGDFIVPGLLPTGAVVMLYADGGSGKTLFANYLAALVANATDSPTQWDGQTIRGGRVLYLQSDQGTERALFQVQSMLKDHPLLQGSDKVRMRFGWDATRMLELLDWLDEWKPRLLIVDSLFAINRNAMAEEKDAAYAHVLDDFREVAELYGMAVIVIHHVNHGGAMRGTKKLRDNADETWAFKRTEGAALKDPRRRLVVEKTRTGVPRTLALTLQDDMTWSMEGEVIEPDDDAKPLPLTDRLLTFMEKRPTSQWYSLTDLRANILFESEDRRKLSYSLVRLADRGHLECRNTDEGLRQYRHIKWIGQAEVKAHNSGFITTAPVAAPTKPQESLRDVLNRLAPLDPPKTDA